MKYCGSCKFYAQGKTCSYCEHPEQKDESAKNYRYYNHGSNCNLWQEGISKTRADWMTERFRKGEYWPHDNKKEARESLAKVVKKI